MKGRSKQSVALGWIVRIVVIAAVVAVFVLPPFAPSQNTTDTAVIESYDSIMSLSRDGFLRTDETMMVRFPAGKHGIYRIFDTADPRRSNVDHPVSIISVERDGEPENYTLVDSASGTKTIRIGDPSVTLTPGVHRYRIRSSTVDVLEPGDDDHTLWWWDVIGAGWQMPIESATVTVDLPAKPTKVECVRGEDNHCRTSVEGRSLKVQASALHPFEPVTVRVAFPAAAVAEPISGPSGVMTVGLAVLGGLLAAAVAFVLVRGTKEKPVGLPVLFEPPEGIYPALGSKVLDEVDSKYALQATLFDLGERGLLSLSSHGRSWDIEVVGEPSQTQMTMAESGVLGSLGLTYHGARFNLSSNKSAGQSVSEAQKNLNSQVSVDSQPYLDRSGQGCLATVLTWLAVIATGIQVVMYFMDPVGFVIWPLLVTTAVFAVVAASTMFDRAVWTTRNEAGRDIWSRVGGFGRFLTTDSSESRFDAARNMDLYPRYLPWALVLGSADAWAQRYREQGIEPPIVPWLLWTGTGNFSMTSMSDSFNSAIGSAAAAYAASQASSGGGGGFSGGSGGGGGGGGSW